MSKIPNFIPENPSSYQGKQVIINSDRLIFNAKDDSILLFSNKAIGFSTNGSFHFDTGEEENSKFVVNAPKIYLGLKSDGNLANEPALLGNLTEQWLMDLMDLLDQILLDFQTGKLNQLGNLGGPTTPSPSSLSRIQELRNGSQGIDGINNLKNGLKKLKVNKLI